MSHSNSLTNKEREKLELSSRRPVVEALATMSLPNGDFWLPLNHEAGCGITRDHAPTKSTPITPVGLAEYLAIATPTHCADGWSYLSRAINSYLLGDPHSAWHLAYYAELRAAQSILSALGCGAFNEWNAVLDESANVHTVGDKRTHVMVWLALKYLAENSFGANLEISSATQILGESLPNLVQYAYPGISVNATSRRWIVDWLFDLEAGSGDKGFRNRCSYNPHAVTPHRALVDECVEFVSTFWSALEPAPGDVFLALDKDLLRSTLYDVAKDSLRLKEQEQSSQDQEPLKIELELAYEKILSAAPSLKLISKEYLLKADEKRPLLLEQSRCYDASPLTPRPVLARATLLLRVASGITQKLFRDAGREKDVFFWLDALAEQQGIVSNRDEIPEDRAELYLDCAIAVEDLEKIYRLGRKNLASLISSEYVRPHLLSQAERVVQWGLL